MPKYTPATEVFVAPVMLPFLRYVVDKVQGPIFPVPSVEKYVIPFPKPIPSVPTQTPLFVVSVRDVFPL